jgi:hypothetical protein
MIYAVKMASCGMVNSPSFLKIGTDVEAILRFCLCSLKGCNYGITDLRDLRCMTLKWAHVA